MANGHGGARPGAGRKRKSEKYESEIQSAERTLADKLPDIIAELLSLSLGKAEIVEERHELALTITVKEVQVVQGEKGERAIAVERQLFPDASNDELVLVERKIKNFGPDREAIKYAVDRIFGRPATEIELDESAEENDLPDEVEAGLDKAYGAAFAPPTINATTANNTRFH